MLIASERPPYVTFETRAIEDRNSSIENGRYSCTNVDFAIITPQGSKDRVERVVSEWFAKLIIDVRDGRFKPTWLENYQSAYKAWKEGNELPLVGTPILTWPVLSPAQVKLILEQNIRTVEDLAAANEVSLAALGMGARDLKRRAEEWLKASADIGKVSENIAALQQQNEVLQKQNKELTTIVTSLQNELQILTKNTKKGV